MSLLCPKTYYSHSGDTLEAIAARNQVSLLALKAANPRVIPDAVLAPGSIIEVPMSPNSDFPGLRRLQQSGAPRLHVIHMETLREGVKARFVLLWFFWSRKR